MYDPDIYCVQCGELAEIWENGKPLCPDCWVGVTESDPEKEIEKTIDISPDSILVTISIDRR